MLKSGSILRYDWYKSHEGREILMSFMQRSMHKRKQFGLLEMPNIVNELRLDVCKYKLFLCGKVGVGKTSTICKLSGNEVPGNHVETPGIQTTVIYWPVKLAYREQIVVVQLELWDSGETALRKFEHILPACKEQMDGVVFVFSFTDRSSFTDLTSFMTRLTPPLPAEEGNHGNHGHPSLIPYCKFTVGTKSDDVVEVDVNDEDLALFQEQHLMPVLRTRNQVQAQQGGEIQGELADVAPLLNCICERLIQREQLLASATTTPPSL